MFGLRTILGKREADKARHDGSACSPDAQLVLAARRGDKEAFVEIVARHQAMVCGITFSILGELAESEDAAQEAFLTAWRKLHTLREPPRLRGWLGEIARNAALGFRRRRRGSETLDETLSMADESPLPDEVVASEEEASLVRASLAKLPENYRLPLVLYYREGQSVRAVAEALEISEDAVKQRLARGREMLREQMSGVVEAVLRRTGPTAVFTMTIAVAIGALAAPAAVAGTAFAAASAGSASASAASTPSLIAVMSTSKGLLLAGALVAVVCLPIGYQVAGSLSGDSRPKAVADASVVTAKPAQPTGPDFENSALLAEWRHLHDVYGRTPEAMPAIYKAINELKDRFRRQAFGAALVAEWVQVDPTNGLAFFLAKGRDGNQRRQFFQEWLARAPGAAVSALLASTSGWEGMARDCLNEIAKEAPSRLGEVVARLPKPDYPWEPSVRDAFALLAQGGLDSARVQAEAVTGPNRDQSLEGVAMAWAKQDFNAAVAWARNLPEGVDKDELIRTALLGRAQVDPVGALQNVEMVPSGGTWQRFASSTGARVLQQASQTDFDATVAWVAANPGHFSRTDLYGLVPEITSRLNADTAGFLTAHSTDGTLPILVPAIENSLLNSASGQRAAVWDWLKTQPESDTIKSLKQEVLQTAAFQDPELALNWVSDLPQGAAGDAQVKELARCLLNGGNDLQRYDQLMAQAPDRLRQPLLEAAFHFLNGGGMAQTWVNRLSQLPAAAQADGAASIGRAWGGQAPEEAITWAASLPAGDMRGAAEAAVVAQWAKKDPQGALDWVGTMPPGAEKDRSSESLIAAIAEQFPQQAWDLALSMSDPAEQLKGATSAAKLVAARDPATALAWVESSSLPPQAKLEIQAAMQSARK